MIVQNSLMATNVQLEVLATPAINPEKIYRIADRARGVQTIAPPEELNCRPLSHGNSIHNLMAGYPNDASYESFASALNDLTTSELTEILAIAWVGRGVYSAGEWLQAVMETEGMSRDEVCRVLTASPLLPDYLEQGIGAFDIIR